VDIHNIHLNLGVKITYTYVKPGLVNHIIEYITVLPGVNQFCQLKLFFF